MIADGVTLWCDRLLGVLHLLWRFTNHSNVLFPKNHSQTRKQVFGLSSPVISASVRERREWTRERDHVGQVRESRERKGEGVLVCMCVRKGKCVSVPCVGECVSECVCVCVCAWWHVWCARRKRQAATQVSPAVCCSVLQCVAVCCSVL